jgi:hypothetical protein
MISPIYLAASSVCMTRSRLPSYSRMVVQGDFSGARDLSYQGRQRYSDQLSVAWMDQAAADMSILMGDCEQAEKLYARAVSGLVGTPLLNAVSCRSTGIQALYQNRLDVAVHCFRRNTETGVSVDHQLESHMVLALIYREAGLDKDANESLAKLQDLAKRPERQDWFGLSNLVAWDLAAYRAIYASCAMRDHIYRSMNDVANEEVNELIPCDELIDPVSDQELVPLLLARQQHLLNIVNLATGKTSDWSSVNIFSNTPFAASSRLSLKYSCLEIGLAAIAGEQHDITKKLIRDYPWLGECCDRKNNTVRIDQNEHLYFLAKLHKQSATIDDCNVFYQRYVEAAFKAIYKFTNQLQKIASNRQGDVKVSLPPLDELPIVQHGRELIPVRCQQAYNYILENSFRPDVSVHEVASIMGVSERWLQLQFKRHYGCSPKAVIRTGQSAGVV